MSSKDLYYSKIYENMPISKDKGFIAFLIHYFVEKIPKSVYTGSKLNEALFIGNRTLEIGFGGGEHLNYLANSNRISNNFYVGIDVDQKRLSKFNETNSLIGTDASLICADAQFLPHKSRSFDRVVATCVVAHIPDTELVLNELRRVTKPGGIISFLLPCEPSFLLRTIRYLYISPKALKLGFHDYKLFCAQEHPFHTYGLILRIKEVFKEDTLKIVFIPFRIRSILVNLNVVCHLKIK
jgi:phosphatidylethanolamine/phosphatidyl-N-methylethanolamine N-methyltransferase